MVDLWLFLKGYTIVIMQGKSVEGRDFTGGREGNPTTYGIVSHKKNLMFGIFGAV